MVSPLPAPTPEVGGHLLLQLRTRKALCTPRSRVCTPRCRVCAHSRVELSHADSALRSESTPWLIHPPPARTSSWPSIAHSPGNGPLQTLSARPVVLPVAPDAALRRGRVLVADARRRRWPCDGRRPPRGRASGAAVAEAEPPSGRRPPDRLTPLLTGSWPHPPDRRNEPTRDRRHTARALSRAASSVTALSKSSCCPRHAAPGSEGPAMAASTSSSSMRPRVRGDGDAVDRICGGPHTLHLNRVRGASWSQVSPKLVTRLTP